MWKDIPNFEKYAINTMGQIKNNESGFILKPQVNKQNGYYQIQLRNMDSRKGFYIHRLVAELFIPNPENLPTVNHKDGNKSNNTVNNLEWCTYSDNLTHSYRDLERVPNKIGAKKRKVCCKNIQTQQITIYDSIAETSRETGISETQIRRLLDKTSSNDKYKMTQL